MKHKGVCYRNSKLAPANAEEYQAVIAAKDLLLDADGKYLGDDQAVFCGTIHADNDTRAPSALIQEQNAIIGSAADQLAEHTPDRGHVIKCYNNRLHKAKKEDPSLRGVHALTNLRIKALNSDISGVIKDYEERGTGDESARRICLEQLEAIVPHHCGIHDNCKHEKWCTYTKVKNENPTWSKDEVTREAAKQSSRANRGKNMSLSAEGIAFLTSLIVERFNSKSIDRIAGHGCSNLSESFWNMVTKFSEGNRLCLDLTDAWEVMCKLAFCRKGIGNIARTNAQVSRKLSLTMTSPEVKYQEKADKRQAKVRARQKSPLAKARRQLAKLSKDFRMGKVDASKAHSSGKVPLSESAKSNAVIKKANRKPAQCSNCKQTGHTSGNCKMPRSKKRKANDLLTDLDLDEMERSDAYEISERRCKRLNFADDWFVPN